MKKLLWTGALALTTMACLTACGDDDSGTSAGGDDELYTCDITAKKVVVKQNAGPYSVTMTYTHNEDGTMTTRYEYGSGHPDVCAGPVPNEVDDEDAEMTCKDNVYTVKSKVTVTTEEFQEYAGAATKACPEPAPWGKGTKPSDDDDDETDTGADDDEGGSVGDDGEEGGSSDVDDDEGSTDIDEEDGEDGDEGGQASDITCNFEKSDDTWSIAKGEGGGEMIVKWGTGKAVVITKTDFGDAETCKMMLDLLATDTEGSGTSSCDGKFLVMEDPDTYKDLSKDVVYSMYCAD